MHVRYMFALVVAFAFATNVPGVARFRPTALASPATAVPSNSTGRADSDDVPTPAQHPVNPPAGRLGTQSKLNIIRDVDGEYAKAVMALPRGRDGFTVRVGKQLDTATLHDLVRTQGQAVGAGDKVQITKIEFQSKRIVLEINGGGKKHFHLRDHLQIGMGAGTAPIGSSSHPGEGTGTMLVLDYGRSVPDMSPDDLKKQLSPLLDFSGETSAALNWIDTIPPEFRKDIGNHQAAVGMDEEMVIAALGRPEQKVRERDPDGNETEDWIYGNPPAKTTFVTFMARRVVRVKEFE